MKNGHDKDNKPETVKVSVGTPYKVEAQIEEIHKMSRISWFFGLTAITIGCISLILQIVSMID